MPQKKVVIACSHTGGNRFPHYGPLEGNKKAQKRFQKFLRSLGVKAARFYDGDIIQGLPKAGR